MENAFDQVTNRNKVKNLHITVPGHVDINLPWEVEYASWCFETANIDHTHICVVLLEPITKKKAILQAAYALDLQPYQVNIQPHRHWKTMVGYHTGCGDKPACQNYQQHPDFPFPAIEPSRNKKTINEWILKNGAEQAVLEGMVHIMHYKTLTTSVELLKSKIDKNFSRRVRAFWLWGPPGTGKSSSIRTQFPELYAKDPNSKWWDGYSGQQAVLVDDVSDTTLGNAFKLWADPHPGPTSTAEVKGGFVNLKYSWFFVTSNQSIDELFVGNPTLRAALARRFKSIYFDKKYLSHLNK